MLDLRRKNQTYGYGYFHNFIVILPLLQYLLLEHHFKVLNKYIFILATSLLIFSYSCLRSFKLKGWDGWNFHCSSWGEKRGRQTSLLVLSFLFRKFEGKVLELLLFWNSSHHQLSIVSSPSWKNEALLELAMLGWTKDFSIWE